jgi:hypothetical protein
LPLQQPRASNRIDLDSSFLQPQQDDPAQLTNCSGVLDVHRHLCTADDDTAAHVFHSDDVVKTLSKRLLLNPSLDCERPALTLFYSYESWNHEIFVNRRFS